LSRKHFSNIFGKIETKKVKSKSSRNHIKMLTAAITLSSIRTDHAGVIPYTIVNGKVYLLLARHKFSGDLGDFGGGVKKEETTLKGAIREYFEESNYIFVNEKADLDHSVAIVDDKMAILFLYIDQKWFYNAEKTFERQKKRDSMYPSCQPGTDEISEILWVTEEQFVNFIKYPKSMRYQYGNYPRLWKVVINFFKKINIEKLLSNIKLLVA